jgi:hypothetical protein
MRSVGLKPNEVVEKTEFGRNYSESTFETD